MNTKDVTNIANEWFTKKGWKPAPFQRSCWKAYLSGKHGLLNAPTGSGKTLALWAPIVMQLLKESKGKPIKGLRAVWITPLKSLSNEIKIAAENFARDLDMEISVGIRNGDTTTSERAKQLRNFPNLLITTPESLHLLLASKNYQKKMGDLNAFVVDEWHELLGTKRGVQIELAVSRLLSVSEKIRIWGISATIGNLDQAMNVLLGNREHVRKKSILIKSTKKKKIKIQSLVPEEVDAFPWRGHIGLHQIKLVAEVIQKSKTTLIFTNTRGQCETWFRSLLDAYPELAGLIGMHHGSIDKGQRIWLEEAIRDEMLKVVVCTSSLDLGVDFAPVESIVQIGSPKGVARFLQRAGRSGHSPGKTSKIYFVPTYSLELLEAQALRTASNSNTVEDRLPYTLSFDVLAQYLITLAVSDGFYPDDILEEVLQTHAFQYMDLQEWTWLLNYITKGSQSQESYDEFKKVEVLEDGLYKVNSRRVAMRHRMQIGTIVGGGELKVKFVSGGYLGTVEEWFISKMNPGDSFIFSGRTLELVRIRDMVAQVKLSKSKKPKTVSWMGGRMTLSAQLGDTLRKEMENLRLNPDSSAEFRALQPFLSRQLEYSAVPNANQLLVEAFESKEGFHIMVYPFEGRNVHEGLCSLLAYRMSLLQPISFSLAFNDYGFEILSDQFFDPNLIAEHSLLSSNEIENDLVESINAAETARRTFRDIAVISGLVFTGPPDKRKRDRHLQSSSQLHFSVFEDYEPSNLLYQQAYSEVYEHQFEQERLMNALNRIAGQELIIRNTVKPTPFSFPIITDRLRAKISSEKLEDRIKRMIKSYTRD